MSYLYIHNSRILHSHILKNSQIFEECRDTSSTSNETLAIPFSVEIPSQRIAFMTMNVRVCDEPR